MRKMILRKMRKMIRKMIEDLKAFCIIYIVTFWVILFRANSKSIQN